MNSPDSATEPVGVPDCKLDGAALGAQLDRYRRLKRHAASVRRRTGEIAVAFRDDLPAGLLEHTLDVERRCCAFVHTTYDRRHRRQVITVETADQTPRLDSLFYAFT